VISIANILIIDIHVTPKAEQVAAREAFEAQVEAQLAEAEKAREAAEEIRDRLLETGELPDGSESPDGPESPENQKTPMIPALELQIDGVPDPDRLAKQIQEQVDAASIKQSQRSATQIIKILETVEKIEAASGQDSEQLRGLLKDIAGQVVASDGDGSGDIELAKSKMRDLLDSPDSTLTAGSRAALEAMLVIDPSDVEIITGASGGQDGFSLGDLPYNFDIATFVGDSNDTRDGIKQEDIDFVLQDPNTPEIAKKATRGFMEALRSPREFNKLFNEYLPWALVILMPLFAAILRLTHWGKRRYYLNQLVFALHFHSFLFVLMTVFAFIVPMVGGENAFGIFWWGTSFYLIIALKVGQDQGWIRAFL